MSVVKRTARRRRRKSGQVGGEQYQLVQGDTVLMDEQLPADGAALSKAQNFVQALSLPEEPAEYTVRLVPVLGPPDDLYRIVVRPSGVMLTWPVGAMKRDLTSPSGA